MSPYSPPHPDSPYEHPGHIQWGHHYQFTHRLLDADVATAIHEIQAEVFNAIVAFRYELHQLPDHDSAALQRCGDSLLEITVRVGEMHTCLANHTDLPLYAFCCNIFHEANALVDQWKAEYEHGGAAPIQHSGEQFLTSFEQRLDSGLLDL